MGRGPPQNILVIGSRNAISHSWGNSGRIMFGAIIYALDYQSLGGGQVPPPGPLSVPGPVRSVQPFLSCAETDIWTNHAAKWIQQGKNKLTEIGLNFSNVEEQKMPNLTDLEQKAIMRCGYDKCESLYFWNTCWRGDDLTRGGGIHLTYPLICSWTLNVTTSDDLLDNLEQFPKH